MCIEERNKILRKGVSGCPLPSPQGVVKVEVSKQNVVNRRVKERVMKQGKNVRSVRGGGKEIRKNGIIRKIRNKRARANRPVDIMDHNISSSLHRAFETQETVIRAWKIPGPRAWVDGFINKKTNSRVFKSRVEKMKRGVRGVMGRIGMSVMKRLLNSKNRKLRNSGVS
jgi:hypothetical protein